MISKFDFLNDSFPRLASYGQHAEQYIDSDIFSCQVNIGQIGEDVVKQIFSYDGIPVPEENTAISRIELLEKNGCLPQDILGILHKLRIARNDALHNDNCYSKQMRSSLLFEAVDLCEWFLANYAAWNPRQAGNGLNHLGAHLENVRIQKEQLPETETALPELQPSASKNDALAIPEQSAAPDAIIEAITGARTGAMIPAPHALRNILAEMSFSPRICQWIRNCIKTGTVREQSYRKLQILYRNRTMN